MEAPTEQLSDRAREDRRTLIIVIASICFAVVVGAVALGVATAASLSLFRGVDAIGVLAGASSGPVPEAYRRQLAATYRGLELETIEWSDGASRMSSPTVTVVLKSVETTGFRHIAVWQATRGAKGAWNGALFAPWEYLFIDGYAEGSAASRKRFESMWVRDHPDLLCGEVLIDERELPYPLSGYEATAYSTESGGDFKEAGVFLYRFNSMTQEWDTIADVEARPEMAVTDAQARRTVLRRYPGFRVVRIVDYPAIIGAEIGDRFVILRHPDAPGFRFVADPLSDTVDDPLAIGNIFVDGPFFGSMDVRCRAFMRDWTRKYPGTVVAGLESFAYTGSSLDFLSISYYASEDSVATADTLFEVGFNYDPKAKRWSTAD